MSVFVQEGGRRSKKEGKAGRTTLPVHSLSVFLQADSLDAAGRKTCH